MSIEIHVEHVLELINLPIGGGQGRVGGLVERYVLCVNKNRLDNTDVAQDLWLRFHAAV
jgi:hypothetical protein